MLTDLLNTSITFLIPHNKSVLFQLVLSFSVAFSLLFVKIWVPDVGRYSPFLLFSVAIILCGWFAGLVSSLALTILSSLLVSFIFIAPFGSLNQQPVNSIQAGAFVVESFFLCFFVEYVKQIRATFLQQEQLTKVLLKGPLREAIILIDQHNMIVGWNLGAQKLFGYKEEEIKGKPFSLICDKKNWFDQKSNVINVRVTTRYIYSNEKAEGIKIKILQRISQQDNVNSQENFSSPAPLSTTMISPSPIL